jgi:hypothetical protein
LALMPSSTVSPAVLSISPLLQAYGTPSFQVSNASVIPILPIFTLASGSPHQARDAYLVQSSTFAIGFGPARGPEKNTLA